VLAVDDELAASDALSDDMEAVDPAVFLVVGAGAPVLEVEPSAPIPLLAYVDPRAICAPRHPDRRRVAQCDHHALRARGDAGELLKTLQEVISSDRSPRSP